MKLLAILLLLSTSSDTTALVDAAKEAKEKRKKSTSKVITNKDLKKSKSKLTQLSDKDLPKVEKTAEGPTMLEKQAAERKTRDEAVIRLAAAEKAVADLERELARIEQSYFEENDPNVRDTTIARRFADAKSKLETAKLELTASRAAHDAAQQP
jgi:hypothetical protein